LFFRQTKIHLFFVINKNHFFVSQAFKNKVIMKKEQCYHLGKITKPHGLKGEVQIWLDVDLPEAYEELEALFLETKGEMVPYIIEQIQIRGKKSILKLEDFKKIEDTEKIIGLEVYLPLKKLPKLKGNQFYYHDVIGYTVFNETLENEIGKLKAIYESTGQDLFAILKDEKEILIPIVDNFIVSLDHDTQSIIVNVPDGLIELYLS
jgi:16S rRNA processing protein RimM